MKSVVQEWALRCSLMQQSVLLGIIRGPDGVAKYHPVKPILRWYRRCLLLSALDGEVIDNPADHRGGSFTGPSFKSAYPVDAIEWERSMVAYVDNFMQTMDEMPIHYWLHMLHAVEIMGYKHDNARIADWWMMLYRRMVHAMHVFPESREELDMRLGDTLEGWIARSDPAITK